MLTDTRYGPRASHRGESELARVILGGIWMQFWRPVTEEMVLAANEMDEALEAALTAL
jgi:hypothetical protein